MMSGRGRGRGRGAVPSGPRPVARDDEGNVVVLETKPEGPPPLYPVRFDLTSSSLLVLDRRHCLFIQILTFFLQEKPLPELPKEAELDELLPFVKNYNNISHNYRHSPFCLRGKDGGKPVAASIATLASVVTLDPEYFPSELYSEQLKR